MTQHQGPEAARQVDEPEWVVLVLDESLGLGQLANAAAVLGLTSGATVPGVLGAALTDGLGEVHSGTYPRGLPVLRAPQQELQRLRAAALASGVGLCDFPSAGQTTTDYAEFGRRLGELASVDVEYAGLVLHGNRKQVNRLTGSLPMLR